jgi:hypothetical protein
VRGRLGSPREAFSFGLSLLPDKESPRAEGIEKKEKQGKAKKVKHPAKSFDVLIYTVGFW